MTYLICQIAHNRVCRVFKIVVRAERGGDQKFYRYFFTGWRQPEEEWFWQFELFSKLKTAFCEYRTSIKIKINMIQVSKQYELKQKLKCQMTTKLQKKCCFYWAITWKWLFSGVGWNLLLVVVVDGGIKFGAGGEQIFGWYGELPQSPK